MLSSNYHTHSKFCDGCTEPELVVIKAIELEYKELGFSSHAPYKNDECSIMKIDIVENYFSEINRLKNKYKSDIQILTGLEIDHISGHENYDWFNSPELDYTLGSVHFVYNKTLGHFISIDEKPEKFIKEIENIYDGNVQNLIHDYYHTIREMVLKYAPDILGHMDIIKKFNQKLHFFDEDTTWYKDEIIETLDAIKTSGTIVEINTRGYYRGWTREFYPSNWIIEKCVDLKIPMIINVDAHHPNHLKEGFDCISKVIDYDALKPSLLEYITQRKKEKKR